tara:strand:- start:409 stop:1128 length:720 start_codon:yes stop_codon:yes gene_type:complete
MKVAVVFIGTDKYLDFLPKWYESCEEYLLPDVEKKYLVFTNGEIPEPPKNVVVYKQEHLEWPYITLYRFKMIIQSFDDIKDCDYLLFLDADMRVVDTVTTEDLIDETKKYIGVHHPCHYLGMEPHNKAPGAFEVRPVSRAAVSEDELMDVYYQGCLWGGKLPQVLDMVKELDSRTDEDHDKDIIAQWHDESHLNKFYIEHRDEVHTVSPSCAYPEVFASACTFDPKIVHLAKDNSKYHV